MAVFSFALKTRIKYFNYITFCKARTVPGAVEGIREALRWTGVTPDNLDRPVVQSQRLPVYQRHLEQLISQGDAYRCFCPKQSENAPGHARYDRRCLHLPQSRQAELLRQGQPHVVRFRLPRHLGSQHIEDAVFGQVAFEASQLEDAILLKSDGYPTYHWANIVDDREMGVNTVMRGQEWLPSTPLHTLLYRAMQWPTPRFIHLPLLLNADGSKLSKRQGHASVDWYRQEGYLPAALLNFCALLGWTPPSSEVLSLAEMSAAFSLSGLHKAPAIVALDKLSWFNRQHLQRTAEIGEQIELLQRLTNCSDGLYLEQVIRLMAERVHLVKNIPTLAPYFFSDPTPIVTDTKVTEDFAHLIMAGSPFDREAILEALNKTKERNAHLKPAAVVLALRLAITGVKVGASLTDTILLLGRERVLRRLLRINKST